MSEQFRKRLCTVAGGLLAIGWLVYCQYLYDNLPRTPDETVGRVYPFSFRGVPGYANLSEIAIFWVFSIFIIGYCWSEHMDQYLDKEGRLLITSNIS